MELREALALCAIFEEVDGGCSVCVRGVIEAANGANLGFTWVYEDIDGLAKVKIDGEA